MDLVPFLIPSSVRSGIVLAAAWGLATALTRRASASTRHFLWATAIAVAVLLPVVAAVSPSWPLPVRFEPMASIQPDTQASVPPRISQRVPVSRSPDLRPMPVRPVNRYGVAITSLWLFGALATVGWFLVGHISIWRLRRSITPTEDAWADEATALAQHPGFPTAIPIGASPRTAIPIVCGVWQPMVVVPLAAVGWSRARIRAVLLHEAAHVARRDALTQAVAQLACAIYWFNPLAWVAARYLRIEREHACDDAVVAAGVRASDYADHLLDIARHVRSRELSLASTALPMASCSQLEGRLMAILNPTTRRTSGVTARLGALATVLLVAAPAATATVSPAQKAGTWNGSAWHWSSSLGATQVFRVYGPRASIRAVPSGDGLIHVDAHRHNAADVAIEVRDTERRIAVCFDGCGTDQRPSNRWDDLRRTVFGPSTDVEVVVSVPAGVRFAGGSVSGDITVDGLGGDIGLITVGGKVTVRGTVSNARIQTVDGDVLVELPPGTNHTLNATTTSGAINSAIPIARGRRGNQPLRRSVVSGSDAAPTLTVFTTDGDITVRRR